MWPQNKGAKEEAPPPYAQTHGPVELDKTMKMFSAYAIEVTSDCWSAVTVEY